MRTTNKAFKEQVRNHIHEIISLQELDYESVDTYIDEDMPIQSLYNIFHDEMLKHNRQFAAGKIGEQQLFKDWIAGLPSSFNVDYTDHDIENNLKTWWEAAGQQYQPDKMQQSPSDLYFHLVTREFYSMLNKEGKLI